MSVAEVSAGAHSFGNVALTPPFIGGADVLGLSVGATGRTPPVADGVGFTTMPGVGGS
ncbi:MAG TPA: hypothetical protein VHM70_31390 [Polyangiaceae bacterium]|jgi:hypothetical protein|nr:hypothetical protein [Polyangiaceae bacterium]